MRVYAGKDPITGKRHNLIEVIPPGPKAWKEAEAARARLLQQIAESRNPRTSATVDELLTRYLDQFDGSPNTLQLYRTHVRNHISPCLRQRPAAVERALRSANSSPGSRVGAARRQTATRDGTAFDRPSADLDVPREPQRAGPNVPRNTDQRAGAGTPGSRGAGTTAREWLRRLIDGR